LQNHTLSTKCIICVTIFWLVFTFLIFTKVHEFLSTHENKLFSLKPRHYASFVNVHQAPSLEKLSKIDSDGFKVATQIDQPSKFQVTLSVLHIKFTHQSAQNGKLRAFHIIKNIWNYLIIIIMKLHSYTFCWLGFLCTLMCSVCFAGDFHAFMGTNVEAGCNYKMQAHKRTFNVICLMMMNTVIVCGVFVWLRSGWSCELTMDFDKGFVESE
jgi:hypothetical protein